MVYAPRLPSFIVRDPWYINNCALVTIHIVFIIQCLTVHCSYSFVYGLYSRIMACSLAVFAVLLQAAWHGVLWLISLRARMSFLDTHARNAYYAQYVLQQLPSAPPPQPHHICFLTLTPNQTINQPVLESLYYQATGTTRL